MVLARLVTLAVALFAIYKFIAYLGREWVKADINEELDQENEVMDETIKASHKVDNNKLEEK